MYSIEQGLQLVRQRIASAERLYGRKAGEVRLLAVSKTRPAQAVRDALLANQFCFGESYIQEAVEKVEQVGRASDSRIEWHFIGRIQGNKTRLIAENFDWVHSLDSIKHARRLSEQRPENLSPLKVCLQVNVDLEASKGGVEMDQVEAFVDELSRLPNLQLEGLMTLPAHRDNLEEQRRPFARLRKLRDRIARSELPLATLSMGMSDDLEAAVAEGATIVRIGTAIFGPRDYAQASRSPQ